MFSASGDITRHEILIDLDEDATHIDIFGRDVAVKKLFDYRSETTDYLSRHFLLENHLVVIISSGMVTAQDILNANQILIGYFIENKLSNLTIIWDIRRIHYPGIKIRKALYDVNKSLSKYASKALLIVPPRYRLLIKVFNIFSGDIAIPNEVCDDFNDAFSKYYKHSHHKKSRASQKAGKKYLRSELLKKSKKELVEMIEDIREKQKKSTNKVVEAITRMSEKHDFSKVDFEIDENDPNYELINAFILLQQDMEEIIRDHKKLNRNLELKVAERIVDVIDKESNLRAILDNSDRLTWLMNTRYELIDFNVAFSNEILKKYKKAPRVHQNVLDLIDNTRERDVWKSRFDTALKGRPGIYIDQDYYKGQERVYEIKVFPIRERDKIKGVSVFVEDITELKKSQIKLIEKNRTLEKLNSELDNFVYRVSHDLRAPLTSILGLINLMKLETEKGKMQEYIALQEKSITKLDRFINDIIDLSRNSRLGIAVNKIDFDNLLNEIFDNQTFMPLANKIERIIEIEKDLEFYSDKQRLSVILSNLISNSFKYANPFQEKPYVKVKVYTEGNEGIIEIEDNGIGISNTNLPKVFTMFFRANHQLSGSGLGLYIVKETVEKLNGTVTVKSGKSEGTTFTVVIPNLKGRYGQVPKE